MGYGRNNIVDDAEAFGLELIGTIELSNADWEFNLLAVVADVEKSDCFYITTDSGCSCPSPFESHTSRSDLTRGMTAHQVTKEILDTVAVYTRDALCSEYRNRPDDPSDLIARIMRRK